jgi:hypothetical protein
MTANYAVWMRRVLAGCFTFAGVAAYIPGNPGQFNGLPVFDTLWNR